MFFFSKSKITIDLFTNNSAIYEYFRPVQSRHAKPKWFKNLSSHRKVVHAETGIEFDQPTIRQCDGIRMLYEKGFMIPMWSDLIFETVDDNNYRYYFSEASANDCEFFTTSDSGPLSKYYAFKLTCPWVAKENRGVNFLVHQPFWNQIDSLKDYFIPSGVLDFKNQHSLNVNILISRSQNVLRFNSGEMIMSVVPLTEKKIELKYHLISNEEYNKIVKLDGYNSSFSGKFKKNILRKKENGKKKCPI